VKIGIIGAGPAGLTMAKFLKHECVVLEKNDYVGGLASSVKEQGFTYDFGPHIAFSRDKKLLNQMVKSLGDNVCLNVRNNKIFYKDRILKYPFENDLKSLSLEDNYKCLYSYLFNKHKKKYRKPENLKQWFLSKFGEAICQKYLFPYNEKVWNIPVEKLSMLWADRIPSPPPEDVIKSSIGFETEGYSHQLNYFYPKTGGYQAISEAWSRGLNIKYNFEVKTIEKLRGGRFVVSDGKDRMVFDKIVSTILIHELVKKLKIKIPTRVLQAVRALIVNPMFLVTLGVKGVDKNKFTAIYFPDSDYWVNRVSFPTTFSKFNSPKGCYTIQAEITCKKQSDIWKKDDKTILKHVLMGLKKYGLICKTTKIVYKSIRRVNYAYVVYDKSYKKNVKIIRDWFPRQGVFLSGRFSYFEYVNVDGIIERSKMIADKVNSLGK